MRHLVWALAALVWGAPAMALEFENCSRADRKVAEAAIGGAAELALRAAAAVGDTPEYATWFGAYDRPNSEAVRANLKAINRTLLDDQLVAVCIAFRDRSCESGTYAFVLTEQMGRIHFCRPFFAMPTMLDAELKRRGDLGNGTREGTIIHELSHFPVNGGTSDDCYGRDECAGFALGNPGRAARTADSYQYFTEDIVLAWVRAQP